MTGPAPEPQAQPAPGSADVRARARAAWAWVTLPLGIALASRAYSGLLVLAANALSHPHRRDPFAAWDAGWYLQVARGGYHAAPVTLTATNVHHDFAFFPLWPLLIHATTLDPVPAAVSAVALANLLFVAAGVLTWRLLADRFGASTATGAVALLAFNPAAYVFSLAYSEPLFLLLAAGYFLSRREPVRHGLVSALAMLARIAGAAIVVSAMVVALGTRGRERQAAVLAVVLGCLAFAAWWTYVALLTHDPAGFLHGSPSWGRSAGLVQVLDLLRHHDPRRMAALAFTALIFAGSVLLLRRDPELAVYSMVAVALGLLPGGIVSSMPRYALAAFPAFAALAARLGRRGTLALGIGFALAQWFFVSWAFVYPHVQPP